MFLDATDEPTGDVAKTIDKLLNTVRPTEKSESSGTPVPADRRVLVGHLDARSSGWSSR